MAIQIDPEENETRAFQKFTGDLAGKRVLEIGCGDGRLTWRYVEQAGYVVGIDPEPDRIKRAKEKVPERLQKQVEFHCASLEEFAVEQAPTGEESRYDLAILSWSL